MPLNLTGSFVAAPTPFNADGAIDFGGLTTWIDFHAANGTKALLMLGSTGEVSTLSKEERQAVIRHCVKNRNPGLPLWFGCSMNNTETTIEMVRFAAAEGADGAVLTPPSYVAIPEADAVEFYRDCADASPIPLAIYNNPTRVKTDLTQDHIIELAKHPKIAVLKESCSRPAQIAKILHSGADIVVMCCDSPNLGLVVPTMALGGHGTSNMTGNVAPQEMAVISTPWGEDGAQALRFRETHQRLLPLMAFNYSAGNPIPIKSLLRALGMPVGAMRKPYRGLEGEALERGVRIVKELGLVEKYGYSVKPAAYALAAE
jgi:4-hydroxy-tetrahydrodipicolinate synthase